MEQKESAQENKLPKTKKKWMGWSCVYDPRAPKDNVVFVSEKPVISKRVYIRCQRSNSDYKQKILKEMKRYDSLGDNAYKEETLANVLAYRNPEVEMAMLIETIPATKKARLEAASHMDSHCHSPLHLQPLPTLAPSVVTVLFFIRVAGEAEADAFSNALTTGILWT